MEMERGCRCQQTKGQVPKSCRLAERTGRALSGTAKAVPSPRALPREIRLAADADGAEAQDDVAAGSGPAKAGHRVEAREEQHLIELVLHFAGSWTGENLVVQHLTAGIDGDIDHQAVRQSEFGIVIFRSPVAG
jgi:hypothetical protein